MNELLDQLGLDEETANRALLRLYARGGWLKWEELLPPELPVEARDRLVKVCRMINGTLTLGEARAALAQAKLMLRAYDNAREPMAA